MKRNEVKEQYKWKTDDIFSSDEDWERQFAKAEKSLDLSKFAGTLHDSDKLLQFFKEDEKFSILLETLGIYAHLKHDEDTAVSKYSAYFAKIGALYAKYSTELAFFDPEMAKQDEKYLKSLISDKRFSDYEYILKKIIKRKAHTISEKEERLIGMAGEIFETFNETFGMIDNIELPLSEIEWEGKKTKISHGLYGIILHSDNREKRKEVYEKYYGAYTSLINTLRSVYYGNVKKDVYLSKVYKYNSCLERALFDEDVDRSVYDNLLKIGRASCRERV